jgi:hypothetical protein
MLKNIFTKNYRKFFTENVTPSRFKKIPTSPLMAQYELEREEYNQKMKEYRDMHRKTFWEEQTKVENAYIEEFLKTQKEKKIRDDDKLRTSVIRNSMACYNNIVKFFLNFRKE